MTFVPVQVIDKTAQTDPRVHGGPMAPGDPSGIIWHHTGSHNEEADYQWLSHWHPNPVSVNQLVKRDGTIIKIAESDVVTWHAGVSVLNGRPDCNTWCMGLEICNAGDGTEPYTAAQLESVAQTTAYNCALYHIPDANVATHARVALPAGRKNDPLKFPSALVWARIAQLRGAWPYDIPLWVCNE